MKTFTRDLVMARVRLYFRLLDSEMQKFAALHQTLESLLDNSETSVAYAEGPLKEAMREIAVVLTASLSCL